MELLRLAGIEMSVVRGGLRCHIDDPLPIGGAKFEACRGRERRGTRREGAAVRGAVDVTAGDVGGGFAARPLKR